MRPVIITRNREISGLTAGTYTLTTTSQNTYQPNTMNNVQVTAETATNVGLVTLTN